MERNSQNFEPLSLRREQFAIIAFVVFLAAWIPYTASIAPSLHVVKADIGEATPLPGVNPLFVTVLRSSEIRADSNPVTLRRLSELAGEMKSMGRTIVLKPDACAPYDTVIRAIVIIKIASADFAFARPDYPTRFDKNSDENNMSVRC